MRLHNASTVKAATCSMDYEQFIAGNYTELIKLSSSALKIKLVPGGPLSRKEVEH